MKKNLVFSRAVLVSCKGRDGTRKGMDGISRAAEIKTKTGAIIASDGRMEGW